MEFVRKDERGRAVLHHRLIRLEIFMISLLILLLLNVGYLQFIQGEYFQDCASKNSIQLIPEPAPRGLILDCKGRILATNRPSFDVGIIQGILDEELLLETSKRVAKILDIQETTLKEALMRRRSHQFRPTIVARDVPIEKVMMVEERMLDLPGVVIQAQPLRFLPSGGPVSHILGYIGQISPEELSRMAKDGYIAGDIVGKSGIEKIYDRHLRGEEGGRQVEVDVRGRVLRVLGSKAPLKGKTLLLTIDKEVQLLAHEALGSLNGAIVVMDVKSGDILALLSKPDFDPNLFASFHDGSRLGALFNDPSSPFLNRSIQGLYPPGSLFKIIVTLAALEKGVIDPSKTLFCPGHYLLGGNEFRCWKEDGHGYVNLIEAITHSCNVYFYQVGMMVGVESLVHFARLLGLGRRTGIELLGEETGFVPTPTWKRKVYHTPWYPGDTVNLSIGQSYIQVTPIQMARLMAILANGGKLYRPKILKEIQDQEGRTVMVGQPVVEREVRLSRKTMSILIKGLRGVVDEGTGRAARVSGIGVAGKTGTAQNPHGKDHAWFICFAPLEDPKVAIAVLVEHGGMGGGVAAPIAGKILKGIFKR